MPKIVSYSLTATATQLAPPANNNPNGVSGTFVTPATPTVGLGESGTTFANAVQLPADAPVKLSANDVPHAILDTGETHTLVVLWSGPGL